MFDVYLNNRRDLLVVRNGLPIPVTEASGRWRKRKSGRLARISHSVEAHRGANQRKFFCEKEFALIRGAPRGRQSVAQNGLILERWKAGLWKRLLMLDW